MHEFFIRNTTCRTRKNVLHWAVCMLLHVATHTIRSPTHFYWQIYVIFYIHIPVYTFRLWMLTAAWRKTTWQRKTVCCWTACMSASFARAVRRRARPTGGIQRSTSDLPFWCRCLYIRIHINTSIYIYIPLYMYINVSIHIVEYVCVRMYIHIRSLFICINF